MLIKNNLFSRDKNQKYNSAFTIVELLVVIVVIGILAAISFVSYAGITERAIAARIKSDLSTNTKLLELYKIEHDEYPRTIGTETNCPDSPIVDNQYCLKVSEDDDTLTYEGDGGTGGGAGDTYTLTITDDDTDIAYEITPGGTAVAVESGGSTALGTTFVNAWGGIDNDDAYSIALALDGGYVITGDTWNYGAGDYDAFIAKYISDGTLSWNKTWGGDDDDFANSIIKTSDGGYVIAGNTRSYGAGGEDAFIAKYTSDGTLSWDKTWGGLEDERANSIIQTSDGGYVIAGSTWSFDAGYSDAFIAKYTPDGTLSWNKTWGGDSFLDGADSIIQTSDGGYAITGNTDSFGAGYSDAFIAKYTSDGTLSWNKTWGGDFFDRAYSIIQNSDGGYVITGDTWSYGAGERDAFIAKFTSDGTLSWDNIWGGTDYESAYSVVESTDGGFVIAGSTNSYGAGYTDAFIAKYTSDGTLSWNKIWGGSDEDSAFSITNTSDAGFIIAGSTASYGAGGDDAFIAKYDPYGNISDCPASMCKNPSASTSSPSASLSDPTAIESDPSASVSDPSASVSSPNAVSTSIAPVIPPPTMTETFSSQELYVVYPGEDQTVCKEWTTPPGKMIKGFMVSQETEGGYDFFTVSLDGVEKYNKSGYKTDEYVNTSAAPGTTLSACLSADSSTQDGYGGQVTGVLYD